MTTLERVRLAGMACVGGGVLWVLVLLADVVAHDRVYDTMATYRVWEALLIVVMSLLLAGVAGLAVSGATGSSRIGRIGLAIALAGRASQVLGEVRSFAQGKDDEVLVPLGAMLTAIGMLMAGIAVVRAGRWTGRSRFAPIATAIYPFVAMFPIVAFTGTPSTFAISLWGVLWVFLGLAMQAEARSPEAARHPASASAYS